MFIVNHPLLKYRFGFGIVCVGCLLSFYGLFLHALPVLKGPATDVMPTFEDDLARTRAMIWVAERTLVQDVTYAGVKRWTSGDLQQTYTIDPSGSKIDATGKKADRACPT